MSRPDGLEQRQADLEDRQSREVDHDTAAALADQAYRDAAYLNFWLGKVLP